MAKKLFPQYPPFINRKAEQKYLMDYFQNAPTSILFVYWPKSTWKTTLIEKVYKKLPKEDYAINYLDMRRILTDDFMPYFLNLKKPEYEKDKNNVLSILKDKLQKVKNKWKKSIIIIDEICYLENIYFDEDKKHYLLINY